MKAIALSGQHGTGKVTLVDDDIFDIYGHLRWYLLPKPGGGCSVRYNQTQRGKARTLILARLIMQAQPGQEVDHIDNDGLNNQRSNLRLCLHRENSRNRRKPSTNTSGYKGVFWSAARQCWEAKIRVDDQLINLGRFISKDEAACAYNLAAIQFHGAFANINDVSADGRTTSPSPIQHGVSLRLHPRNTSGYRGVYWSPQRQRWEAFITRNKQRLHLIWTPDKELAAYIYDQVALQLIGSGARLNLLDKERSHL